ncbi:MAG: YhgE/Pip domain-containing protein [Clostridium sp.]|jgi:putative membrane protein|uniref:YhgE/Pip domain-containing protein n=1 Tax=Clostridium sp. TaxID=1506 RepID=UPI0025BBEDF7|nr:YhgE/Pip domain-containing protein [Clostridium sp.]MCH3963575.1 YhgE/Pip domain-containing protein [Clostridium sp.]MCI1714716.1 YhgE/Pip domain-containing protein [Clostridium sp.]MCI1799095.1 YhgE/Pip domain-containing protein [Clostridium sp.]MCI1812899.1 YhgE/Pip domain-containing protein [Clostridium sp.]MCI1869789.1 YhgE/Pip domain-containing protein [Clostridium sp.]
MKVVFKILKRDFRSITGNLAVLITIIIFCFLPSSYAIVNIKASWDPYSKTNTSRLPIAVVNKDEGGSINGKTINVGNQIINELKKDRSINWVTIDEWQGNYGLNTGKYYSLIEIPEDFSNRLLTLVTPEPQKPNIVYRSNEKLNAAATEITSQAKDVLADRIKSNFVKISSREVLKQMNYAGKRLNDYKPEILQIKDSLENSIKVIDETKKYLSGINENSREMQDYLNKLKNDTPKLFKQMDSLQNIVSHGKSLAQSTRQTVSSAQSDLSSGINEIQSRNTQLQAILSGLENMNSEFVNPTVVNNAIDQMDNLSDSMIEKIDSNIKILNTIDNVLPNNGAVKLIDALSNMKNTMQMEKGYLLQLKQLININGSKENIDSIIAQLSKIGNQLSSDTANIYDVYSSTGQMLDNMSDNVDRSLESYDKILQSTKEIIPQLNLLANTGISISEISISHINQINKRLGDIQNKLDQLSSSMNMINEKNLDYIIHIMWENPEISNLLSSPVELKNVQLYNLGLFGYGVTPFYTTLSIWVGILLLSTILTCRCREFEDGTKVNMIQEYSGKLFLFMGLSLIQTSVTILGEFLILGIRPMNIPAMIEVAFMTSITFSVIIFTCIFILGNVGKALVTVLMIFQIFGTGGIYPLEIISTRLANMAPFLPFTYSINGFREAIGGPNWDHLLKIFGMFGCFMGAFFIITPLKKVFQKQIQQMENEFKKSQL